MLVGAVHHQVEDDVEDGLLPHGQLPAQHGDQQGIPHQRKARCSTLVGILRRDQCVERVEPDQPSGANRNDRSAQSFSEGRVLRLRVEDPRAPVAVDALAVQIGLQAAALARADDPHHRQVRPADQPLLPGEPRVVAEAAASVQLLADDHPADPEIRLSAERVESAHASGRAHVCAHPRIGSWHLSALPAMQPASLEQPGLDAPTERQCRCEEPDLLLAPQTLHLELGVVDCPPDEQISLLELFTASAQTPSRSRRSGKSPRQGRVPRLHGPGRRARDHPRRLDASPTSSSCCWLLRWTICCMRFCRRARVTGIGR